MKDFYFKVKFSIQVTSWTCSAVRGRTLFRTHPGTFLGEDQAVALKTQISLGECGGGGGAGGGGGGGGGDPDHHREAGTDPAVFCMMT